MEGVCDLSALVPWLMISSKGISVGLERNSGARIVKNCTKAKVK